MRCVLAFRWYKRTYWSTFHVWRKWLHQTVVFLSQQDREKIFCETLKIYLVMFSDSCRSLCGKVAVELFSATLITVLWEMCRFCQFFIYFKLDIRLHSIYLLYLSTFYISFSSPSSIVSQYVMYIFSVLLSPILLFYKTLIVLSLKCTMLITCPAYCLQKHAITIFVGLFAFRVKILHIYFPSCTTYPWLLFFYIINFNFTSIQINECKPLKFLNIQ